MPGVLREVHRSKVRLPGKAYKSSREECRPKKQIAWTNAQERHQGSRRTWCLHGGSRPYERSPRCLGGTKPVKIMLCRVCIYRELIT